MYCTQYMNASDVTNNILKEKSYDNPVDEVEFQVPKVSQCIMARMSYKAVEREFPACNFMPSCTFAILLTYFNNSNL